jgi:hypothetical protein
MSEKCQKRPTGLLQGSGFGPIRVRRSPSWTHCFRSGGGPAIGALQTHCVRRLMAGANQDSVAKVRILVLARALMRRAEKGKAYGILTAKFVAVLEHALLFDHDSEQSRQRTFQARGAREQDGETGRAGGRDLSRGPEGMDSTSVHPAPAKDLLLAARRCEPPNRTCAAGCRKNEAVPQWRAACCGGPRITEVQPELGRIPEAFAQPGGHLATDFGRRQRSHAGP